MGGWAKNGFIEPQIVEGLANSSGSPLVEASIALESDHLIRGEE